MNDLVFHPVMPGAALVLAALAIAMLLLWSLRRGVRSRSRAITLAALRCCALAALVVLLAQPQQRHEEVSVLRPQLAVLVDNSQSMGERVDPQQTSRIDRITQFLHSQALEAARKDFDVRLFGFDQSPLEAAAPENLKFDGTHSNISDSVARLEEHFKGQPLAGILLLSDGLERTESAHPAASPQPSADAVPAPHVPVFAFELEAPFKPKNLAKHVSLASLDYPPRVVTGWDTEVRAGIAAKGMSGQTLTVELWREGQKFAEQAVAFNEDEQTRQVAFPISQPVPGAVHYELRIPDPAADKDAKVSPFVIEAMEPGNRVLYLQNALGFDFKFLRKAIVTDRNLQLNAFVRWTDGRLVNIASNGGKAPALDLSVQALANTAVVILGDLAPDALSPEYCRSLRDFVDHGGGLVVLGGPHSLSTSGLAQSALGPLLPVKLPAEYREGTFPMKITDTGLHHPVFGSLFTTIEDFPPLLTFNCAPSVMPTAEVLVETQVNGRPYPAIVSMRYGQGRVVVVLSDTLWRWRLAAKGWSAQRSPYDTFWTQLMDWLIPKELEKQDSNRLELFCERSNYLTGETPEVRAILRTANAKAPETLALQIRTPDEKTLEYTLRPAQLTGRDGRKVAGYRVTVEPNVAGVFRAKASASVNGATMEGETRFVVTAPATELTGKPIDRNVLKRIAQTGGGHYYPLNQWDNWRRDLHVTEQHTSKLELRDQWNHPLLVGFLLLMLAADWATRKFWNLP
jgi:uncharacterized membrane protein